MKHSQNLQSVNSNISIVSQAQFPKYKLNIQLIIVDCTIMQVDQLLQFCSYFYLNKSATHLPVRTYIKTVKREEITVVKGEKSTRRKIEVVETKKKEKVAKPKVEVVSRKQKSSVSPIKKQEAVEFDINYFISHISGQTNKPNHSYNNLKPRPNQELNSKFDSFNPNTYQYSNNQPSYIQNRKTQQNYQQKKSIYTDRSQKDSYIRVYQRPQQRQSLPYSNQVSYNWQTPQINKQQSYMTRQRQNLVYQSPKILEGGKVGSYTNRREPLNYSPRSFLQSNISDRSLSKSRNKRSSKPFYDVSKLTPKQNRQSELRDKKTIIDQSIFSNSFVSVDDLQKNTIKKNEVERRQTASTTLNGNKQIDKKIEYDLDDEAQEFISRLTSQQRRAPIAISMNIRSSQS